MNLEQNIRTVGMIATDETRISHIHAKFEGYIERIFVNYVGQPVTAGQPLLSIYPRTGSHTKGIHPGPAGS